MPWATQVLHVATHHHTAKYSQLYYEGGCILNLKALCPTHRYQVEEMVWEELLQGGKQQKQSLLPWKQSQTPQEEVVSRGRRGSLSLPGLFQSTTRYSHEYSFSLAKNLCTSTNTYSLLYIYIYICAIYCPFSSSPRSANWLYSVLLDTEQLDKFKTLILTS